MLFLVSTPIGNLSDISARGLEALRSADLILCEDTRHSLKLLEHYHIRKPLNSYHKFNEQKQLSKLIEKLQKGETICLISDAGTPLISDPGFSLVQECIALKLPMTAIPGPSALIQALVLSGMSSERFQFVGFLPKKEKELRALFNEFVSYPGVTIAYESPHRLANSLNILASINPLVPVCIARELTKLHETYLRGSAEEIAKSLAENPPKGECVLLMQGQEASTDYEAFSIEEHIEDVQTKYGVSKREAIKIVAELRGLNKRELYRTSHQIGVRGTSE